MLAASTPLTNQPQRLDRELAERLIRMWMDKKQKGQKGQDMFSPDTLRRQLTKLEFDQATIAEWREEFREWESTYTA